MKHGPVNFPVLQALIREVQLDLLQPDTMPAKPQLDSYSDTSAFWTEEDGIQMWNSIEPCEFDVLRESCARYQMWQSSLEYRALLCGEIGAA